MAGPDSNLNLHVQSAKFDQDDKQELAAHVSRGSATPGDDPTRSTLHTGEQSEGVVEDRPTNGGAPSLGTGQTVDTDAEDSPVQEDANTPTGSHPAPASLDAQNTGADHPGFEGQAHRLAGDQIPLEFAKFQGQGIDLPKAQAVDSAPETSTLVAAPVADVEDEKQAPTELVLDGTTILENAAEAVVGTITVMDADSDDSHQFEVSDPRFEVVDGQLRLKPGVALDHEESAQIEVDVTVTDTGGLSLTERFTIDVEDLNERPELVSLDGNTVAENASGTVIGGVSVVDPDQGETHSFEISDTRFHVIDGQLRLKPGVSLDHEAEDQIEISVKATDQGGLSTTETFSVTVQDINEAPIYLHVESGTENLIRNGSFEQFDLDQGRWKGFKDDQSGAWTDANGIEIWDRLGGTQASEGDQLMEMDHGRGIDSISQVVQTQDGQLYDLSLDLRERIANGTDTVEVYWNGNMVAELDPKSSDWETFQIQVVGTGQDKLGLREAEGQNDTYGALVDNITLTEAQLTVAENIAGAVVGQVRFDDPDLGDTHRFEVSDDRFEVADGYLRLKPGVALDHDEAESLSVDVTVIDEGGLSLTESVPVQVADMAEMAVTSGFRARYFDVDHSLRQLDDVDWDAAPTHQEITTEVNYTNSSESFWDGGARDTFGVEVTGTIQVTEAGAFTFHLGADDGAMLILDGVPVVDNDGLHGYRYRSGQIDLEPGAHAIEVRYFENFGHAGLKLEWEGPGLDGRELVTAPDPSHTQTVAGTPVTFDIDASALALGDETRFSLGGLPSGTQVEVGGQIQVVGPEGRVDLDGLPGDLLTVTPPSEFAGSINASLHHTTPTAQGGSHEAVQTLSFSVHPAQLAAPSAQLVGGFHASYFDTNTRLKQLDDINWTADPTHQEFVAEIHYENSAGSFWEGGSKDTFGARIEGQVTIEEGGTYTFFAGADDGVVLFVDGVEVIDNDGLHGFRTRSGQVELEPGSHDIEVRYFENHGHAGLKLEWDGPDTEGRTLVQADSGLAVQENGTFELGIDLAGASGQASISLEGLPAHTLVVGEDAAVMSDGGPVDLSGWNVSFLEISPPPGFEGAIEGQILVSDTGFNGASVSSSSAYSLEVGDVDHNAPQENPDELQFVEASTSEIAQPATPWDEDHADTNESEPSDVLSEPVVSSPKSEIASIETEAYERVDW